MEQGFVTGSAFNHFVNLDNIEWLIADSLVRSQTKYADYLWKLLKYNSLDALNKPSVPEEERRRLIYNTNGESTGYRVFLSPFTDDGFTDECSFIRIYISSIVPIDHLKAKVLINVEVITHNKIVNVRGDASLYNPQTNPVELDPDGEPNTMIKSRVSTMAKQCLALLNGRMVNGIGVLSFDQKNSFRCGGQMDLWNNRKFFGYTLCFATTISGVSETPDCGD